MERAACATSDDGTEDQDDVGNKLGLKLEALDNKSGHHLHCFNAAERQSSLDGRIPTLVDHDDNDFTIAVGEDEYEQLQWVTFIAEHNLEKEHEESPGNIYSLARTTFATRILKAALGVGQGPSDQNLVLSREPSRKVVPVP